MSAVFLSGVVAGNRVELIPRVQRAVSAYGDVLDSRFFSDLSVSLEMEMNGDDVKPMCNALEALMRMDKPKGDQPRSGVRVTVFLHIFFIEGKGNLTVDTPAVPG